MRLRRFASGDAPALQALWVASWNATLPTVDFAARQGWFADWLAGHIAAGGTLLCAVDAADAPLGFVGIEEGSGHMEQIAVHPAAFGRGVGATLLDAAKARCPAGITLRVNQENPRAVAFYRRAGFTVTAEGINPGGERKIFEMRWIPAAAPARHAAPQHS